MSAPAIRGWCPGAHRPMASGDGLVVRVRPSLGELSNAQARGVASLAQRYGNGLVDLTNRANLQVRGVTEENHKAVLEELAELSLLDVDPAVEGRRNVVLNPLRDGGPQDVQSRIAGAIEEGLHAADLSPVPSKFGFVVDAGSSRRLGKISGDIRIEGAGERLIVRADGQARGRGVSDAQSATDLALDLARWFVASGGVGSDRRGRMARHLAAGASLPDRFSGDLLPNTAAPRPVPGSLDGGILVASAFGQLTPDSLVRLAEAGSSGFRITPWRMVFLPGVRDPAVFADYDTLIVDPNDPILRVHACTGSPGCPQASTPTRDAARVLAASLPNGADLHVSGCRKGCAHPRRADFTLVGRDGRFDLVKDGLPWDDPIRRWLDPRQAADLFGG